MIIVIDKYITKRENILFIFLNIHLRESIMLVLDCNMLLRAYAFFILLVLLGVNQSVSLCRVPLYMKPQVSFFSLYRRNQTFEIILNKFKLGVVTLNNFSYSFYFSSMDLTIQTQKFLQSILQVNQIRKDFYWE